MYIIRNLEKHVPFLMKSTFSRKDHLRLFDYADGRKCYFKNMFLEILKTPYLFMNGNDIAAFDLLLD